MTNPLLEQTGLPAFSSILPEHVEPAIVALLEENRSRLQRLLDEINAPSWETLVEPIEG